MKNPRVWVENINKYVRNLSRLEKLKTESIHTTIKYKKSILLEHVNKGIKDRTPRGVRSIYRI